MLIQSLLDQSGFGVFCVCLFVVVVVVDDCDEELMDQWSLIKVIEWHNFFLLSPKDTKSHHGLATMNISMMVLSPFPPFFMAIFV